MTEPEPPALQQGGLAVEIGPITIPTYLNQAKIATIADNHKLQIDQFNRWAEPLEDGLGRVLAENMAILLNTANVYIYPVGRDVSMDYQVKVAMSRFGADSKGTATLVAFWSIIGNDGQKVMSRRRSAITEQAASKDIDAIVAAQNNTLQKLSREIADVIQSLQ